MGLESLGNLVGYPSGHLSKYSKQVSLIEPTLVVVEDLFGGSCHVCGVVVDASANDTEMTFLKLFNGAVLEESSVPEFIIPIAISEVKFIPLRLPLGEYFPDGLSLACTTEADIGSWTGPTKTTVVEVFGSRGRPAG